MTTRSSVSVAGVASGKAVVESSRSEGDLGGTAAGRRRKGRIDVTLKLSQLQDLCKRDPDGYREEYDAQVRRLQSQCDILALSPSASSSSGGGDESLMELIQFAAAVSSSCYRGDESNRVADLLVSLLLGTSFTPSSSFHNGNNSDASPTKKSGKNVAASAAPLSSGSGPMDMSIPPSALALHRDVRRSCVSALILMRNKGAVHPLRLLELFFRLLASIPGDKVLRLTLHKHMVQDVRNINKKGKRDEVVNRSIQSLFHRIVQFPCEDDSMFVVPARRAVDMVCELYRRHVWTDSRTVAILESAVQSSDKWVMQRAMRFFLNIEETMAEDTAKRESDEWENANTAIDFHKFSKKTRSRQRHVDKQLKTRRKHQLKREQHDKYAEEFVAPEDDGGVEASRKLYPALELLQDAQGLAESVLKRLRHTNFNFETKLLMINFVTRLVGNQELLLLPLYPLLQRYMGGHQRDVTAIMAYAVQACHEYVPPDEVYSLLKTIAHNFITERCSGEQMAVGINAARAICARVPSVLSKEESRLSEGAAVFDVEAFVRDLCGYAKHRDRSVVMAGRAWTNFIRETYPTLLRSKDRGATGSALHRAGQAPLRYGEHRASAGVAGADLLVEYESKKRIAAKMVTDEDDDSDDEDDDDDKDNDGLEEEDEEGGGGGTEEEEEGHAQKERYAKENDRADKELKKVKTHTSERESDEDGDDDDSDGYIRMDDVDEEDEESGEWEIVGDGNDGRDESDEDEEEDEEKADTGHSAAGGKNGSPRGKKGTTQANVVDEDSKKPVGDREAAIELRSMSSKERQKLQQEVSSTRIFTAKDFRRMRKLVEREEEARRDPRAAARRRRVLASGLGFEKLSDDEDSDDSEDEEGEDEDDGRRVHVAGAVTPSDIMAEAKRKRMSKAERLEKIIAGRAKFETKARDGGATNTEKKRRKNFVMVQHSASTKRKLEYKGRGKKRKNIMKGSHDAKKRRRRL